jgi:transposase
LGKGRWTIIHPATDALGNLVRLLIGPGQRNDITQAPALIEGIDAEAVIADKGYEGDPLHDAILDGGADPVIPPKSNRRAPHH